MRQLLHRPQPHHPCECLLGLRRPRLLLPLLPLLLPLLPPPLLLPLLPPPLLLPLLPLLLPLLPPPPLLLLRWRRRPTLRPG